MAVSSNERLLTNPEELIYLISVRLADCISQCYSERTAPRRDSDESERFIREMQDKIKDLRLMREELETNLYGDAGV